MLDGLKSNGVHLHDFHYSKKKELHQLAFKKQADASDAIYLPSFTHGDVSFIKKISNQALVFDPLISKYLTKVFDYKEISRFSPRALKNFYKDKRAMSRADLVLADTAVHADYFSKTFNIPSSKFKVVPVGYPSQYFYPIPKEKEEEPIHIGFYGSFAPLQGVNTIIDTAYNLRARKNVIFHIIGDGFDYKKVVAKAQRFGLTNVRFEGKVAYQDLNVRINDFDFCLGIFGAGLKTELVVPNKVFHYMACEKAVITKDTPAIRAFFEHEENVFLCDGSAESLQAAIVALLENETLRNKIAANARKTVAGRFSEYHIGATVKNAIEKLIS